ncbi:MAG: YebC/PmpR family DNA-binding transcriptional regulator [Synergistales bacterium]|nr:YebC/PmpR family DNA-binding transcriptional regulator [Synergistales bacterium]
MAGHSKWANIKHRKAAQDAKKGNIFQKHIRAIMVAAREGGSDPSMNIQLKSAIERAKSDSVPADNIDRAIKRGTGEIEGAQFEEVYYEAYGPAGVAIMVQATTDNRNRTTAELRALLARNGGSLGEAGCVAWIFDRKGVVTVSGGVDEDELLLEVLEAGGEDMNREGNQFYVYCDPSTLMDVSNQLRDTGYPVLEAEVQLIPKTTVPVEDEKEAEKLFKLLEVLEDQDDVQNVSSNFDIPDRILEKIG